MVSQLKENGSRHITVDVGKKSPSIILSIKKLRDIFLSEKIDIVHARSRVPAWTALLAIKCIDKKKRPKFITTFHGFYSVNKYSEVMAKGEIVIAVSNIVKNHIIENYKINKNRIKVIFRGVDADLFDVTAVSVDRKKQLLNKWNFINDEIPFIMMPGRVSEWKGQDVFIKSLNLIKGLSWRAVIVGGCNYESNYVKKLHSLAKQFEIDDRVHFVGSCSDMPAAYSLASVIVSASTGQPEAFGRIAVEAQAMQVPVIATAHGGSLETIIDDVTGWLVKPGDYEGISNKIQRVLYNEQEARKIGIFGRANVVNNFSLENMCRKTMDIYNEIIT